MLQLHSPQDAARWLQGRVTGALHCDSRKVRPGDGFIAWPGAATDGRMHVASALAQGAAACLVEADSACASHHAVDVLPLVPVTASTSSWRVGWP